MHIPSPARITLSTQTKKNGQPRRPRASLLSVMSNLHLLLRVPSFSRWPLRLHFFARDAHAAWDKWCTTANEPVRDMLPVDTDFGPDPDSRLGSDSAASLAVASTKQDEAPQGIHGLHLDYAPVKEYVTKGQSVFSFEREGSCVVCCGDQASEEGLYAVCTNETCDGVGHVDCWSRHLLAEEGAEDTILPVAGHCPKCKGEVRWGDMMKELTLRVRGQKEVEKLLKKRRKGKDQPAAE